MQHATCTFARGSSFNDISQEADKIQEETYNRLASFADEWSDDSDIAERAMHEGVDFYLMAQGVVQGIMNMFTVGLYHLFEQQLLQLHRQELLSLSEKQHLQRLSDKAQKVLSDKAQGCLSVQDAQKCLRHIQDAQKSLLSAKDVKTRLCQDYQIDLSTFASWPTLEELRLVANTVKHAEGESCTQLQHKRPDLFIPPYVEEPSKWYADVASFPVDQPLAGEGLYIRLDEFTRYVEATKQFWEELAQAVEDRLP